MYSSQRIVMNLTPDTFLTKTLREKSWGIKVASILAASLAAVDPGSLVHGIMQIEKNLLIIDDINLDLEEYGQVILIGIGKASVPMSAAAAKVLGEDLTSGIVLTKKIPQKSPSLKHKIFTIVGGHPVPDQGSLKGAREIMKLTENLTEKDLVLVLLSGGGSSLLTAPPEGISLEDIQITNQVLLGCGADIRHINTIRKHLSLVKGGQLAKHIYPARLVTLILSDVMEDRYGVDDSADMVASGPTLPDPTTFHDAVDLISYYRIIDQLPTSVINHLDLGKQGKINETPKPDDEIFARTSALIIGSNQDAVEAGIKQAQAEGFYAHRGYVITGEAKQLGVVFATMIRMRASGQNHLPQPNCGITGGESTVTLPAGGKIGKGGRNLELALSAMQALSGLENVALVSLASDGEDGVTGAAGAIVTGESYQRAIKLGIDPEHELSDHNSYHVFEKLDDLIITGPTFTNVNDLLFTFAF
jgi:glycerate 2-kinase